MGLLDVMDDPRSMGLLSLGLRLMSTPGKFGTALGQAGMGAMGDYQSAVQTAEQRKFREQQMALQQAAEARAAAAEGRAANLAPINQQVAALQLAAAQAEALKRQQMAAAAADSVLTPDQVAMSTNRGPTMAAAAAAPTTAPGFNWRGYQSRVAAIDPMAALQIESALKKDMPKLKSVETMRTPDGKLANVALFEDGTTRVLPYGVKPEMVLQALGDKVMAIDKNSLPSGASFAMGQSPDSKASNALGYARLNFDMAKPEFHDGQFVYRPTAAAPNGVAVQPAGLTNTKGADDLRKEFSGLPEVKNFKEVAPTFAAMVDAAGRNTPQADINLVYGLAKIFDPTSVVREGEYATIEKSQSIPDWLKGQAQRLAGGARLNEDTRQKLLAEAAGRTQSFKSQYDSARATYTDIANKRLIDPKQVFTDITLPPVKMVKLDNGGSAVATAGPDGKYYVKKDGKTYRVEE